MSVPSDLEIARSVQPRPIAEIAHELGYTDDEIELYGRNKAKVTIEGIERPERERPRGKYVLVTAISPTPLGEGKSTTTVGLAQGLQRIGKKATVTGTRPMRLCCSARPRRGTEGIPRRRCLGSGISFRSF
jgi:formyltetrahydrofolate synthetase